MSGSGEAAEGWAAKLKASLTGTAPQPPAAEAPPAPEPAAPAEEPRPEPEPSPLAFLQTTPAARDPATAELVEALSGPAAGGLLGESPAGPAEPPPPEPEAPLPPMLEVTPQPEPEPAKRAEPPAMTLFDAAEALRAPEPKSSPPPVAESPLLAALTREAPAAPPAPRAEAAMPSSPLLGLLRAGEGEGAAAPSPVIEALRAAPRAERPSAPLPPSPLLDLLRTPRAEPRPAPPPSPTPAAEATKPAPAETLLQAIRPAPEPAPAPPETAPMEPAPTAPRPPLPEREIRAVFELLVGRAPDEAEMVPMRGFTRRHALRGFILAGTAFREAVLAPAIAAALPLRDSGLVASDLDALDALGAGAAGEKGMVVDWFGLRTPVALAPDLAAHEGGVLPRPAPTDPRAPAAEWIGLAASIAGATGTWRAMSIGAGRGDTLLSGAVAARRRGLTPDLHACEPEPKAFAALTALADANGLAPAPGQFQQAKIGTDPKTTPPRGTTVQDLLAGAEAWDWVRIGARGSIVPLLRLSAELLGERVRFLALVTHSRREEAFAIGTLARAQWQLVAELPVALRRRNPESAERSGVQVWRSGLV
jgi:hypothetical protein